MTGWLRRIRGAIGMGLTWAMGWAPIGAVAGVILAFLLGPGPGVLPVVTINTLVFGVLGLLGGTIFSGVLRLTEGRRSFDELTLPRVVLWGALGGLALGLLATGAGLWGAGFFPRVAVVLTGVSTVLGSASAAGTLAIARRAEDRPRLESGTDGARLGA